MGFAEREPVSCKLDEKFAASEEKRFIVKSVRPKHDSSKFEKQVKTTNSFIKEPTRERNKTEAKKQPVYAEGVKQFEESSLDNDLGTSSDVVLLEKMKVVVDHPFDVSSRVLEELEKVAQMFEQAKSLEKESPNQLENKADSEKKEAIKAQGRTLSTEVINAPDDEVRDTTAPDDENAGSLEEFLDDFHSEDAADESFPDADTQNADTQIMKEKVWEDLLFW
jgi:hypothetical protein